MNAWLRASFELWIQGLTEEQQQALIDNWENVMDDAALDRIDSWVIARKVLDEMRTRNENLR